MCGIAGLVSEEADLGELVMAMTGALSHRGPDDQGFAVFGPEVSASRLVTPELRSSSMPTAAPSRVAFGHRRLSIIDPTEAGHQPMQSADGRYWMTYNGEIYNYRELRVLLEREGVGFTTSSDSEVLLAAWAQWGQACLERLVGMWSFAIYDTARETVTVARDPFGIKPLYFYQDARRLAFASEPPALLALPFVRARANPQRLFDFLRFGRSDDGTETFYEGIERFPAGHHATIDVRRPRPLEPVAYWTDEPCIDDSIGPLEAASTLCDLLTESVDMHLRADVPVGAALSGGVDSSAIVCLMRSLYGDRLDLHTFSFIADDPTLSEEQWVAPVVERARPTRHLVTPTADELLADIDQLVRAQGEPILGLSSYAEYRVFALAKEAGVKVVLDGQGADELFGGYSPYLGDRLASMIRQGQLSRASAFWRRAGSSPHARALSKPLAVYTARSALPNWAEPIGRRVMRETPYSPWMRAAWFRSHGVVAHPHGRRGGRHRLQTTLADDRANMFQWQLRSEDRDAMTHGIENRVPFVTTPMVEFARSLPEELLIDADGRAKAVLRDTMRDIVPDEVLDRREKLGFAPPERAWMDHLDPFLDTSLNSLRARAGELIDVDALGASTSIRDRVPDSAVWRLANVGAWLETFDVALPEMGDAVRDLGA